MAPALSALALRSFPAGVRAGVATYGLAGRNTRIGEQFHPPINAEHIGLVPGNLSTLPL